MAKSNRKSADKVGYGKPPKASQFVPGQSGNPMGRPKGSKNFSTILQKELASRVDVKVNGKDRRITKQEAVAMQMVNRAATGDPRVTTMLLKHALGDERADGGVDAANEPFEPVDDLVLDSIVRRIRSMSPPDVMEPLSDPNLPLRE